MKNGSGVETRQHFERTLSTHAIFLTPFLSNAAEPQPLDQFKQKLQGSILVYT